MRGCRRQPPPLIGHVYEEMENPIAPSVVEFINNIEYRDLEDRKVRAAFTFRTPEGFAEQFSLHRKRRRGRHKWRR